MRTRVRAAAFAALALLAWEGRPVVAAAPLRGRAAYGHAAGWTGHPVPARMLSRGGRAGPVTTPTSALSGLGETAAIVGGIVFLLAVAIFVTRRIASKRRRGSKHRRDSVQPDAPSTADLAAQASRALVRTDDAVLTSEQELGFAIAVFGERALASFSAAVESTRAELREAFRLRQLLDDGPANEATTHSRLTEIAALCEAASRLLDEQAEAFDRAHTMHGRVPQLIAEVDAHIAQQSGRMDLSRQVLDRLAAKYTPDAVVAVASNPDSAATRLEFAANSLASAEQAAAAGESGRAAALLQAAEAAADQATDLLTGVLHREAELTQAASAVPAALREIDAEIADATAVLTGTPDGERAALVAGAQAVSDDVRAQQAAGEFDSLVALRDLQQADAALDRALAGVRSQQARRQRTVAVLDEAMLVARSSLTAAEDFITTRRGGVGPTARTRLSEARRLFQQAIGSSQPDPEDALADAQRADALAQQARTFAEQDVAGFDDGWLTAAAVAVAAPGNGGGAVAAAGEADAAAGLRGAVLGGILIDGRAGGIGPGSFGGVGSRGRHSVSHREYSIGGQHSITSQDGITGEHSSTGEHSGTSQHGQHVTGQSGVIDSI